MVATEGHDTYDLLLPTRWGGKRYRFLLVAEPEHFRHMFLSDEAIADHRTLVAEIHLHISLSHESPYQLPKTTDVSKPDEIHIDLLFDWRSAFSNANPAPTLSRSHTQGDIDRARKKLNMCYQSMLFFAKKSAMRQLNRPFRHTANHLPTFAVFVKTPISF